jgi:hypothetical protein
MGAVPTHDYLTILQIGPRTADFETGWGRNQNGHAQPATTPHLPETYVAPLRDPTGTLRTFTGRWVHLARPHASMSLAASLCPSPRAPSRARKAPRDESERGQSFKWPRR